MQLAAYSSPAPRVLPRLHGRCLWPGRSLSRLAWRLRRRCCTVGLLMLPGEAAAAGGRRGIVPEQSGHCLPFCRPPPAAGRAVRGGCCGLGCGCGCWCADGASWSAAACAHTGATSCLGVTPKGGWGRGSLHVRDAGMHVHGKGCCELLPTPACRGAARARRWVGEPAQKRRLSVRQ